MKLHAILCYNNNGYMAVLTCFRALREYSIVEGEKRILLKEPNSVQYINAEKRF